VWAGLGIGLGLAAAGVNLSAAAPARPPARPELHLPPPDYLPPQARGRLRARMGRHGAQMSGLMRAVVLLDHETTARLAQQIADEEMIGRGAGGDWPALLPDRFFELQDGLRDQAAQLAGHASARDSAGAGAAAGRLLETCVGCHAAYLAGGPDRQPERR
jgi:hypothetical protein